MEIDYCDATKYRSRKICLRNIVPMIKALYITLTIKPISIIGFITTFKALSLLKMISISNDKQCNITIFDEGLFHKSRALKRFSKEPTLVNTLKKFSKIIGFPDILVILEADPDVIFRRRTKRNRTGDKFDYQSIVKEINLDNPELNNILDNFKSLDTDGDRKIKVVRIKYNNDSDLIKNAMKITREILHEINLITEL